MIEEKVDIPTTDNVILKGSIYFDKHTAERTPFVIIFAGLLHHRENYFVKTCTELFVKAGYYVLSYDYRAHGETAKQTGKNWVKQLDKIFSDVHVVIDWLLETQKNRIIDEKIILFGRSLGGAIILNEGYKDPKAKLLIVLCTRYDYTNFRIKFPDHIIKQMSARYNLKTSPSNNDRILLSHCKDDERIPFEDMLKIKEQLGLRDENTIVYDTGGHAFMYRLEDLFVYVLNFIKTHL